MNLERLIAEDPYGATMIAATIVFVIGIVVAVAFKRKRGRGSPGVWLMNAALLAGLGAAIWSASNVPSNSTEAVAQTQPPSEVEDAELDQGPPPGVDAEAALIEIQLAGRARDWVRMHAAQRRAETEGAHPARIATAIAPYDREHAAAMQGWIDEAREVINEPAKCEREDALQATWSKLSTILEYDASYGRAVLLATRLEVCRQRILTTRAEALARELKSARRSFAEKLPERFKGRFPNLQVMSSGDDKQYLRLGSAKLKPDAIHQLEQEGLMNEARELGFERIVLSNGKESRSFDFPPPNLKNLAAKQLADRGLNEALVLDAPATLAPAQRTRPSRPAARAKPVPATPPPAPVQDTDGSVPSAPAAQTTTTTTSDPPSLDDEPEEREASPTSGEVQAPPPEVLPPELIPR